MQISNLTDHYKDDPRFDKLLEQINSGAHARFHLKGLIGSSLSLAAFTIIEKLNGIHLFILNDKEAAAYFYNDIENLWQEAEEDYTNKRILFYPTSYKRPYQVAETDNANVLLRSEVLNRLSSQPKMAIVVTYPEALTEKVITKKNFIYFTMMTV